MKTIKFLSMSMLLIGISMSLNAQWGECLTDPQDHSYDLNPTPVPTNCERTTPIDVNDVLLLQQAYIPNVNTPIHIIRVNIHIWQKNDGTGSYFKNTPAYRDSLQIIFNWLNDPYAYNQPYSNPIPGATFISDSKIRFEIANVYFYQNTFPASSNALGLYNQHLRDNYPERYYNHLNLNFSLRSDKGGKAERGGHNVLIFGQGENDWQFSLQAYGLSRLIAHEFGHCLNLLHNFFETCCPDIVRIDDPDFFWDVFGSTPQPWCDTIPGHVCYHEAKWNCDPWDTTNTCTNNIMSGTGIVEHISALQMGRMHRALRLNDIGSCVYVDASTPPMVITANQTWDFNGKYFRDVVVEPGVTLTITCKAEFAPNAGIIVKPGGKLIVDGGILTNLMRNSFWEGIEVWGDPNEKQVTFSTKQGYLNLKNGAIIENARCGVYVGAKDGSNKGGGYVSANNATFLNNIKCVEFRPYSNNNGSSTNKNISSFRACTFETNAGLFPLNDPPGTIYTMVDLNGVMGVKFSACNFSTHLNSSSVAINANEASFSLNHSNASINPNQFAYFSHFYGFKTAIRVIDSRTNHVAIELAEFNNNGSCIEANVANMIWILSCRFNTGHTSDPTLSNLGIRLENSTQYKIENNYFEGGGVGMHIVNSDQAANSIKNNTFVNECTAVVMEGINAENSNSTGAVGFELLCNKFESNDLDVWIKPDANIGFTQGDWIKQEGAGNEFIASPLNLKNDGNHFIFYLFNQHSTDAEPLNNINIVPSIGTINFQTIAVDQENCKYGQRGFMEGDYYMVEAEPYFPGGGWDIPNIPYDEIEVHSLLDELNELHNQTNDILLGLIADYDAQCYDNGPIIDWSLAPILGSAFLDEQQVIDYLTIASLKRELAFICNLAFDIILHPDAPYLDRDLYNFWLEKTNTLPATYQLVSSYTEIGDWGNAYGVLSSIPLQYPNYNIEEFDMMQRNLDYLSQGQYPDPYSIPPHELDELRQIAENPDAGISAVVARSILEQLDRWIGMFSITTCGGVEGVCGDDNNPPIYGAPPQPNPESDNTEGESSIQKQEQQAKVSLYPNPAQNVVQVVLLNARDVSLQEIQILDVLGRVIQTNPLSGSKTDINISSLTDGLYFIRCTLSNGEVKTNRIAKQ